MSVSNERLVSIYRILIVVSTAIFVVFYWLPYFDSPLYTVDMNELRKWDGLDAAVEVTLTVQVGLFAMGLAAPLLMYFFIVGSREIFLLTTLTFAAANIGFGARVLMPLDMFLGGLVNIADGAILAIAYLTSLSERWAQREK